MRNRNSFYCFLLLLVISQWSVAQEEKQLRTGAERLEILLPMIQGKKVALVVNQTSVVGSQQKHLVDTLQTLGIAIQVIFAPEHGFRGDADAGELISDSRDPKSGLPITSLYGANKKPTREQLEGVDVVLFDIQDVGARFYTYISTLHYVMEACAEYLVPLIVLDRPNPNDFVDGPVLVASMRSFVGMHEIPLLHGVTVGELACMINEEGWLQKQRCPLTVIPVTGWKHEQRYQLPVKPSPNLPNQTAIRLYPSLCFFEATRVSVGRGTPFPFQVIGYPKKRYGTFTFKPRPTKGGDMHPLQKGKNCYGIDLRETKNAGGLDLGYFLRFYTLSEKGEEFFSSPEFFDKLAGTPELRRQIIEGKSEEAIRATWQPALSRYKEMRKKYLLYP
jgi:uncharacterized protein YbbC (DUF1343 family)